MSCSGLHVCAHSMLPQMQCNTHIMLGVHRHRGSSVLLKGNRDRLVGRGVSIMAFASWLSFWVLSEVEL